MSKARDLADLLDSSGDVKVTHLDNAPANLTSATTVPGSPAAGDQWFDTDNGILYAYMTDGTQAQWLDISSANGQAATATAAAGGGAMELISSQTVTSDVSSVEFTGLTGAYSTYKLVIHGNTLTDGSGYKSKFYAGDGTNWHLFEMAHSVSGFQAGSIAIGWNFASTGAQIYNMHQSFPCSFALDITVNDNNNVSYHGMGLHNYNGTSLGLVYGHSSDTYSVTTLKMEAPPQFSDTFNAGTFTLYGIKDS